MISCMFLWLQCQVVDAPTVGVIHLTIVLPFWQEVFCFILCLMRVFVYAIVQGQSGKRGFAMHHIAHNARVARNPLPGNLVYGYEYVLRSSRNPQGYLGALYAVTTCGKIYTRNTKNPLMFHNPRAVWHPVDSLPEVVTFVGNYERANLRIKG